MPTPVDLVAVPAALSAIDLYGIDAVFTVETKVYDDVTQALVPSTPASVTRKVTPPQEGKSWRDGEVLRTSAALVYVAGSGLTFTPALGMKVTIEGTAYAVTRAVAVRSGEQIAIWELRLD